MRQKMEGLEFVPSEAVWERVEKAVANRRRRRIPYFFRRFAVPGVFLAAAAGVLYYIARSVPPHSPATSSAAAAPAAVKPLTTAGNDVAARGQATPDDKAAVTQYAAMGRSAAGNHASTGNRSWATGDRSAIDRSTAGNHGAIGDNLTTGARSFKGGRSATGDQFAAMGRSSAGNHSATGNRSWATGDRSAAGDHHANASEPDDVAAMLAIPAPYCYQPQRVTQGSAAAVRANLLTKQATIALKTLQKTARPWEAGFMGGAGLSQLNRINSSTPVASNASSFLSLTTSRTVSSSYTAPTYSAKRYSSKVQSEVSYMAGIYLEKPLSSRWVLNLGMNLHYYSTRITIGPQVSTYVPASVSLITPTTTTSTQSSAVYSAGDDQHYTNRFYFLELPVGVQWRINKSRMLPLFLEGGASLSRLMGANALLYNSTSGIYYKDASVIQKTQFNISSALMVGLPFHGIRIQMGPQVQYGLTPLINNHDLGDQHFLYTGIRIVVVPGHH